jgi:hypothetical protein
VSDARAEDQDRVFGQPIEAIQDGWCPGCGKRILGRRGAVDGELIVERHGSWLHADGTCLDEYEAKLREAA